jgi:glutamate-ammonia-ligase adenylyltransferase
MTGAAKQWSGVAEELPKMVRDRMAAVAEIYERLIHAQQALQQEEAAKTFSLLPLRGLEGGREDSYEQILHRLSADSPKLHKIASRRNLSARTRRNLHRFLSSALTSSERYAAVLRSASALEPALAIFESSDYLSDVLVRHPEELSAVGEITSSLPARPGPSLFSRTESLANAGLPLPPAISYSDALALLRQHFRQRIFANGVADLLNHRSVFESLSATTAAADQAIRTAFETVAGSDRIHSALAGGKFAIFALGRLGTCEFDLASDADLLFVREKTFDPVIARRLAEQIVDILAAYTQQGSAFPVDTRLRPMGAEGELVTTSEALRDYFSAGGEAQPWEALSFTKLRLVCGADALTARLEKAVCSGNQRFAKSAEFAEQTREMRERLKGRDVGKNEHNFKTGAGGFYDIDFITSFSMVKYGLSAPGANIRQRLHALAADRILQDSDCAALDYAAELFRTTDHLIRLVTGRSQKSLPASEHDRAVVARLVSRCMAQEFSRGLEHELGRVQKEVREIFDRLIV